MSVTKTTKRVLIIGFALALLAIVAGALYLFLPLKVAAEWDVSPETCVITVGYLGEIDYNYIPDVRIWGDGRIVWVEYDTKGNRKVLQGYLSQDETTELVNRLIDAGFFNKYRRLNWRIPEFGSYISVNLTNVQHQVVTDPLSGYNNEQVLGLTDFLQSGAGVTGTEFIPTTGRLVASPLEKVGFPQDSKANYYWPDEQFGYSLGEGYNEQITGEELKLAWEIVNSPTPLVESMGEVYWIALIIPGVSLLQ